MAAGVSVWPGLPAQSASSEVNRATWVANIFPVAVASLLERMNALPSSALMSPPLALAGEEGTGRHDVTHSQPKRIS
jgi:hypothetical protein